MAGISQDEHGKWKIDRDFLTPARSAILDRLDKKHEEAKSKRRAN